MTDVARICIKKFFDMNARSLFPFLRVFFWVWGIFLICGFLLVSFHGGYSSSFIPLEKNSVAAISVIRIMPKNNFKKTEIRSVPLKSDLVSSDSPKKKDTDFSTALQYAGEKILLNLSRADLKNVFRMFKDVSNKNIAIDRDVLGKLTLRMQEPLPWDLLLDLILEICYLEKIETDKMIRIVTIPTLKRYHASDSEYIPIQMILEDCPFDYPKDKVSFDFQEADIRYILRILNEVSGKDFFMVDEDVTGEITLACNAPISWYQILDLSLKMNQFEAICEDNMVRIRSLPTKDQIIPLQPITEIGLFTETASDGNKIRFLNIETENYYGELLCTGEYFLGTFDGNHQITEIDSGEYLLDVLPDCYGLKSRWKILSETGSENPDIENIVITRLIDILGKKDNPVFWTHQ